MAFGIGPLRVPRLLAFALAPALAVTGAFTLSCTPVREDEPAIPRTLEAAVSGVRLLDGKLAAGFAFAPVETAPSERQGNARLLAIAGELQRAAATEPTADTLYAWGVAQLLLGEYARGVETLHSALLERPLAARILSDLGVGQLALATRAGMPEELPRAAQSLEEAVTIDPRLAPAWFTKAIVLEHLHMPVEAAKAWTTYLELDSSPGWATEARRRLADVQAVKGTVQWRTLQAALSDGSLTDDILTTAISRYPVDLREMVVRDILPAWGSAPDTAVGRGALARASRIAAALEARTGDPYFRSVIEGIQTARGSSRAALARAVVDLGAGLKGYAADRPSADVRQNLERASSALRRRSGLVLWADISLARLASTAQQHGQVQKLASAVASDARRLKLPTLEARAHWLLGTSAFTTSRWSEAASHYDQAIRLCDISGEEALAAIVETNAAVLARFLGNRRATWTHRARAGALMPADRPLQVHGYLTSGAAAASTESLPLVALLFQNEVVTNATSNLSSGPQTEAFISRARMLARVNKTREAMADLAEAASRAKTIQSEALRTRFERAWLLASAEVRTKSEPARAVKDAGEAESLIAATNEPIRLAEAVLLQSRALTELGRVEDARAAAARGMTAVESAIRSIDPRDPVRVAALEPVWALYADAARLELVPGREDHSRAFAISERRRARTQLDLLRIEPLRLDQVQQALAPDQGILMLDQYTDELITWWITRQGVDVRRTAVAEHELKRIVSSHRLAVDRGQRFALPSAQLFDVAVRPYWPDLRKKQTVAVIADGGWNHVAWPTLWDTDSGTELVTALALVMSPSSTVALRYRESAPASVNSALVVSAAAPGGAAILPGARAEAKAVAESYRQHQLVEDSHVAPERILRVPPSVDVLHVSSHAIDVPAYPQMSHLLLGAGGSSARLFVRDVAAADLSHLTVAVLAACSTAGGTAVRGEGSVGIAWGFLTAGVRNVIATLQEIEDDSSRNFFTTLHRLIAGGQPTPQALQATQREMAASGVSSRVWGVVAIYGSL